MKYAAVLAALAICSGCGSSSAGAPSSAGLNGKYVGKTLWVNGRPVTAARMSLNAPVRDATIVPAGHAPHQKFEYVIGFYGSYASIFHYPKSVDQHGTINNVGGQGCTNVLYGYGKETFWIVAAYNQIEEFKVPQKPIKTLSVSYTSLGSPSSCAMNAAGDLAVGILYGAHGGDVVIFKNATGPGTAYSTAMDQEFFDGYDDKGNLFADGFTGDRQGFALVELRKGSSKFQTLTTSNTVYFPGSVQWDGKYITVFDQNAKAFYQYTISGTKATLKHTISISGNGDCAQTWIVKGLAYCGDAVYGAEVYKYPAGGPPVAKFTGSFNSPLGVVAARR